ncbi:MAG: DUF1292 domain-containing protein [Candidatus Izemoplasmatales bacterium]|jgi:hypothetical protein|nr:DUF1292 domain-containing protein [Candidatus Izemoplasmatales bacterium]
MTDKEIYELLLSEETLDNIELTDDDGKIFELEQLGIIPLHGVVYAIMNLVKIEGVEVKEEDQGLVMLELDYDEESDEYFVSTIEDDDLFDEVLSEFEKLPESKK